MKPLILLVLILSAVIGIQAQTIADAARKERERQSKVKATRIFTTQDAKSNPAVAAVPSAPPAAEGAAAATPAPPAGPDPVQQWMEETEKLRAKVRQLKDQETATQLESNRASAQINAPVTSQSAKDQAARTLGTAQEKLSGIRNELAKTQTELQEKTMQGPPQKK